MTPVPPAVVEVDDGATTTVVEVPAGGVVAVDVQVPDVVQVAEITTGAIGPQGPPGEDGTTIAVGPTPPPSPAVGDLWVDTS